MPEWALEEAKSAQDPITEIDERMAFVIRLSRMNFEEKTGGPFAAAVFERDSGRIVSFGVNRVMPMCCSSAHAEVMAYSLAQNALGTFDLGGPELPAHQLVVNWRPCAMCYGATLWSGIRSLVVAGDGPELEELTGFDEGPICEDWRGELAKRGIDLVEDVLRSEACEVFRDFGASDAFVYNARHGRSVT